MITKVLSIVVIFCLHTSCIVAQPDILITLKRELERHTKNDTVRVNLLNAVSYQYQWMDFDSSFQYATQSLALAEQLAFQKGMATARQQQSYCYWLQGYSELSIENAMLAVSIAQEYNLKDILAECYRIMAMNYRDQRELEKAGIYIRKAEKLATLSGNFELQVRIYNTMGVVFKSRDRNSDSLKLSYFMKALSIIEEHKTSEITVCQILSNIGGLYILNDPDLAIQYFNKALISARKVGNKISEAGILGDFGYALTVKTKYTEAEQYLLQSLRLSRKLGLKRIVQYTYDVLAWSKANAGKSVEAFHYMKAYYGIRDSLIKTRQIAMLEARYETAKKEQAIKLLEQEKRIQTLWTYSLIVGSLLLVTAFVIIHRLQQLRSQKAKELLLTQKQLNAKLKETDEMKSKFFANVSHEFRTPLSLIIAPVEKKLKALELPAKDIDDLRLVSRNARRLLDLVNQLLDLSKIDAGKMSLKIQQDNIDEFIKVMVASFDSLAESRKIRFSKNIGIHLSQGWFDADKLEKILTNVLSNAFKFTPPGGTVDLSIHTSAAEPQLKIKISDTGSGIPEDDLTHIFSPFYQSRNSTHEGMPGTGLGLALVSELVKLHQGKIELISKVSVGTSIIIQLPVTREELPLPAEIINGSSPLLSKFLEEIELQDEEVLTRDEGMDDQTHEDSILIVEDNPDLRSFIGSCFEENFTIFYAADGEEGFSIATEKIPTLIISDVMMPKMNGLDLSEKLKTDERSSHIPIILLTAKVDIESRIEGLKTGADDYLAKPFSAEELRVRVTNLIAQRKKLAEKFRTATMAIAEPLPKEASLDDKFILRAKNIVDAYMADPAFGVEKFAEEMHLSRAQLFRKIKALRGVSPTEFINNIRLQKAADLIRAKADTLTQISYSVGFNEQSYFAKRFRKKFGVSPTEYSNASS